MTLFYHISQYAIISLAQLFSFMLHIVKLRLSNRQLSLISIKCIYNAIIGRLTCLNLLSRDKNSFAKRASQELGEKSAPMQGIFNEDRSRKSLVIQSYAGVQTER